MINEGDKIRLITGEIARIAEVLKADAAYIAEIFKKEGGVTVDQINHRDIESVFIETEQPLAKVLL